MPITTTRYDGRALEHWEYPTTEKLWEELRAHLRNGVTGTIVVHYPDDESYLRGVHLGLEALATAQQQAALIVGRPAPVWNPIAVAAVGAGWKVVLTHAALTAQMQGGAGRS